MVSLRKAFAAIVAAAVLGCMCVVIAVPGPSSAADEHEQEMQQLQEKWEALSDRQRNAVYKLFDRKGKAEIALMDEYAALGLISEEEAEAYAGRVSSWLEAMEESGKMPPVFGRSRRTEDCKHCKPGNGE